MKKILFIVLGITLLAGVTWGGIFYYKNLRGAGTAFGTPPVNIADVIDDYNQQMGAGTPADGENTTAMPLQLPSGFSISIFARGLVQPRVIAWDPEGTMLVSIPNQGKVVALIDADHNGAADDEVIVIDGLRKPHGLLFRGTDFYIAETHQLAQYAYDAGTHKATFVQKLTELPSDGYNQHYTRTLLLDPRDDNRLLVSVGSSCNVCHEQDARRSKILAVDLVSGTVSDFATGLRNSVFMAVEPGTNNIFATEMGRDLLGDDTPPDEINLIERDPKTGNAKNYGWPICYGKNIHDDQFDKNVYIRNPCMEPFETPSYIDLQAHSAPLGLTFVPPQSSWPQAYWGNLLVAYHGSWNRSTPTGYDIVRFSFSPVLHTPECPAGADCPSITDVRMQPSEQQPFINGWLTAKKQVLGRPVDLAFGPDGALYVSDDKAGVIYRVTYSEKETLQSNATEKADLIQVANVEIDQRIGNPFPLKGRARGTWFFEATFPVTVVDANGKEIGNGIAQADGEWMTKEFVPFTATLTFKKPATPNGFLLLKNDNPSGLSQNDDQLVVPVRF